jgi:hypothetical protein
MRQEERAVNVLSTPSGRALANTRLALSIVSSR